MLKKLGRGSNYFDYVLFVTLFVLVVVYLRKHPSEPALNKVQKSIRINQTPATPVESVAKVTKAENSYVSLIDARIQRVSDARSSLCKHQQYYETDKVSIIIDFFDYSFYDLKLTLGSVINNTPRDLIGEILVVDSGSTLDYIREDSDSYVAKIPGARMVRLKEKVTTGKARSTAAEEAKFEILAFLSTNTICNVGWLQPLLKQLKAQPDSFAVPHLDAVNDPVTYNYIETPENMVTAFTWGLAIEPVEADMKDALQALDTPVMRGDIFAVTKQQFLKLGGYDVHLMEPAGQALELSFRAWRCGAKLRTVPCSRVGILTLNFPFRVLQTDAVNRIAHIWLTERINLVHISTKINPNMEDKVRHQIQQRQDQIGALQCTDFQWYLQNVASSIYTPSKEVVAYGFLKARSGNCAYMGVQERMDMGSCTPARSNNTKFDLLWEHTDMMIKNVENKCWYPDKFHYITLGPCNRDDALQQWKYENGRLVNVATGHCAIHVTDPDNSIKKGRQIVMDQACPDDKDGRFSHWEFIVP